MVEKPLFENIPLSNFPQLKNRFLFTSPWQSLLTQGCVNKITTPLLDAQGQPDEFAAVAQHAFQQAKRDGIHSPIMVGAIPFDSQQPSALFIPEQVQGISRQQLVDLSQTIESPEINVSHQQPEPDQAVFTKMVADAVTAMKQGQLDKVVLSRLITLMTQQSLDVDALMARIITQNPTNYQFHLPLDDQQVLLGASPELLLRKQGQHFSSCPLAGTAKRHPDPQQDQLAADTLMQSTKDRHEHQLVTQAMQRALAPETSSLSVPETPMLVNTASLWHLATEITGSVSNAQLNALQFAGRLHPTPALSGFPHHKACQLIRQLEPFERQLFGGMVGWCDDKGNGEWVVTIRCANVAEQRVTLFAGAGIVPASDPMSEWQETGAKLSTMLSAFGLK